MNPNYTPKAAADAERAMQEVTRQTTEQLDKARLANRPAKVRQDEMNRVLDALESHPFRKALISQHLEVKEISLPVNGRVIVTLGSLAGDNAVHLELLVSDARQFEDKNLVFEFMLAPRRVKDDTVQPANSGHGPEVDAPLQNASLKFIGGFSAETLHEAAVSVAMPEKEHVAVSTDAEIIDETNDAAEQDDPEAPDEYDVLRAKVIEEQARDRGGVE